VEADRDLGLFSPEDSSSRSRTRTPSSSPLPTRFHSSFGCDYDSDYTGFSQAFYDEALRETFSFVEAFEAAKETVGDRERRKAIRRPTRRCSWARQCEGSSLLWRNALPRMKAEPPQKSRASSVRASESTIVLAKGR